MASFCPRAYDGNDQNAAVEDRLNPEVPEDAEGRRPLPQTGRQLNNLEGHVLTIRIHRLAKGHTSLGDALVNLDPDTIAKIVNDEL
jgi:hypothetical protein